MKSKNREVILFVLLISFLVSLSCSKASSPTSPSTPVNPTVSSFTAAPGEIVLESSSTLSWSVNNAQKVEIDQGVGVVSLSGTKSVTPNETTTYTLTATNGNLTATRACEIVVKWQPIIVYITDTGTKYHRGSCQYLSQSKIQTTLAEACQKGYDACSVCKPPNCR
jgi:hypothetical protein